MPDECAAFDTGERARGGVVYRFNYLQHVGFDYRPANGGERNQRDLPPRHVLFVVKRFVACDENVETSIFGGIKQPAVL